MVSKAQEAKDMLLVIAPLAGFIDKNPRLLLDLGKMANDTCREAKKVTGERHYNPRVLTELFEDKEEEK